MYVHTQVYIYICCWFTLSVVFKTGSLLRGSRAACLAPVWPLGWARTECAGEPCDTAGCVWVSVVGHSQCRPGSAAGAAGAAGAAAPAPATRSATLACSALDLIFFFFPCWARTKILLGKTALKMLIYIFKLLTLIMIKLVLWLNLSHSEKIFRTREKKSYSPYFVFFFKFYFFHYDCFFCFFK